MRVDPNNVHSACNGGGFNIGSRRRCVTDIQYSRLTVASKNQMS